MLASHPPPCYLSNVMRQLLIPLFLFSLVAHAEPWRPTPLRPPKLNYTTTPKKVTIYTISEAEGSFRPNQTCIVAQDTFGFSELRLAKRYNRAVEYDQTTREKNLGINDEEDAFIDSPSKIKNRPTETEAEALAAIGRYAYRLKKGQKVIFLGAKNDFAQIKVKKKFLYVDAFILTTKEKWAEKIKKDGIQYIPAKEGAAVVRCDTYAFYTELMLEDYYKALQVSETVANNFIKENARLSPRLEQGQKVIILSINRRENIAEIMTGNGKKWHCLLSDLAHTDSL